MKKIILLAAIALSLYSCNNLAEGEYIIKGSVPGMSNGLAYLGKQSPMGMGMETIDTIKIVDGKFEIKGTTPEPEIHFLRIDKIEGNVPFILEGGEIDIEVNKDSVYNSKLSGTYSNEEFSNFNKETKKIQKRLEKKVMDFQVKNMAKMTEAQKANDTVTMNALRKEYEAIQKDITDYTFAYPKSHPKSYISILITEMMLNRGNLKINEIETIYNSLDESLKKTKPGKTIKENIETIKKKETAQKNIAVGKIAPDFKAPNPEGKIVSLKENLGKVTLIDFWASWCPPCRKENPNVVALYNEFHNKGFNIISVSLDTDAEKWKTAIAKDKLTWAQISNLKEMKDPIAIQYGISQIPTTFLLDASGKIVAIDLSIDELKAKINELLAAK